MDNQPQQNTDNSQLHWFWKLTTKWWFFPAFYLALVVILTILAWILPPIAQRTAPARSSRFGYQTFFVLLWVMPQGLFWLIGKFFEEFGRYYRFIPYYL